MQVWDKSEIMTRGYFRTQAKSGVGYTAALDLN
jgi:hypothetical protein